MSSILNTTVITPSGGGRSSSVQVDSLPHVDSGNWWGMLGTSTAAAMGAVGLTSPITGSLIRMRANYIPKESVRERPGLFSTLSRVNKTEGWGGWFKGVGTMAVTTGVQVAVPGVIAFTAAKAVPGIKTTSLALGLQVVDILTAVPTEMLVNRAVALDETPAAAPSILESFTLPGLLPAVVLRSIWSYIIAAPVATFGVAAADNTLQNEQRLSLLAAGLGLQLLGSLVTTPLQVIITRLSIQRDLGKTSSKQAVHSLATERDDAIVLAPMTYSGFFDAAQTIVSTEGWAALYRGWTWEALRIVLASASFASILPA